MRRLVNIFIIVLLLSILMVLTNPSERQFIDWAVKQAEKNTDTRIEKILGDFLGRPILQMSTIRKDYLLFSVFIIDKSEEQGIFIGLLKYIFIELK